MIDNLIDNNKYYFNDFTEKNYRKLIKLSKSNYDFISFLDYKLKGKNLLWRHDVDFSVNRAFKLASIEHKNEIFSTYFFHLHNSFYNILEEEITLMAKKILELGHELGLHFDPYFYQKTFGVNCNLIKYIKIEKNLLEELFETKVIAFSLHNPDTFSNFDSTKEKILDMVNVYSKYIKTHYEYCSDSNGYWRFNRLENIISNPGTKNLHVLTHPGWWVPEPMSPRDRITRCIEGRAKSQHKRYDDLLKKYGRENIK